MTDAPRFDFLSDQEVAERVDAGACESDRAFFRHHPQRNFRVRPAWAAEVEEFIRQGGITSAPPRPGWCWWVSVHQLVRNKVRLRWALMLPHDAPADPPENIARQVWRRRVPPAVRKRSRALKRDIKQILGEGDDA
jgi:hypothetical protein